jgi:CBS domain-containing protein
MEGAMKVREIMTSNPTCCTPRTSLREVARMMVENDCGPIPVIDDERARRAIGVVTDRDIVCRVVAEGLDPSKMTVGDVMSTPLVTVRPDMKVEDCGRILEERQIRRAPVTNDEGQCCGIISLADIAQTAPEKLTGEIVRSVSQRTVGSNGRAEDRRAI